MHTCPRCGFACDCSGDWDDCEVMTLSWVANNCTCDCEEPDTDFEDDDFEEQEEVEMEEVKCTNCGYKENLPVDTLECIRCNHILI